MLFAGLAAHAHAPTDRIGHTSKRTIHFTRPFSISPALSDPLTLTGVTIVTHLYFIHANFRSATEADREAKLRRRDTERENQWASKNNPPSKLVPLFCLARNFFTASQQHTRTQLERKAGSSQHTFLFVFYFHSIFH